MHYYDFNSLHNERIANAHTVNDFGGILIACNHYWMVIIKDWYQIMAKFTDQLIVLELYPIKFLLLQMIIIQVSLYCCDKLGNFGTNTHKLELYLLSFGHFLFSMKLEKVAK